MTSTERSSSLAALASVAQLADDMDEVVCRLVTQARRDHRTWADIGAALGISRQAAHARYGRLGVLPGAGVEVDDVEAPQ